MTFAEYARRTKSLRSDTAHSRPRMFFLMEAGGHAAVMALVLIVADVTPLAFKSESPLGRLWFIGLWSSLMAAWNFWRLRSRRDEAHASAPPAI
jgi:hypothetical protein